MQNNVDQKKQIKSKKQIIPLRESASMIIFNQTNNPQKLLMFKRKANISFGNAVVFPGGVCDQEDRQYTLKIMGFQNFEEYSKITAIRQLFEQTGILLMPIKDQNLLKQIKSNKVTEKCFNYDFFCKMWKNHLELIVPLIRFLTVQFIPGKRFDTIFYTHDPKVIKINIANIDVQGKQKNLDNLRMSSQGENYFWQSPVQILRKHEKEQILLIPPQIIMLNCLKNVKQLNQLLILNKKNCYEPILMSTNDLKSLYLFGDQQYGEQTVINKQPESKSKVNLIKFIKENQKNYKDNYNKQNNSHNIIENNRKKRRIYFSDKFKKIRFQSDYAQGSLLYFLQKQNINWQRSKL